MKYLVANAKGRILHDDASRASDAINWARNRIRGASSVRKIPEIIRVVGEDSDQVLLVADEDTARQNGWGDEGAENRVLS